MTKKILIISGSPRKNGNTSMLIKWFSEAAGREGVNTSIINAASLKIKGNGCRSCRTCQKSKEYGCAIKDDASKTLLEMAESDVVVFATPLYFFSASAQIKIIVDRMFSLYKWDNDANTMKTILKGKTLVLMASAFEDKGLDALERPFKLTAEYTGMKFRSLLIPGARISGEIVKLKGIKDKVISFASSLL